MLIESSYKKTVFFGNGHLETIIPYFFRKAKPVPYIRERIETVDDDFLDLDWLTHKNDRLVILSHGLEGCSRSSYIQGLTHYLANQQLDVVAWNNRGCSGEMNRQHKMYHSGASYDLREVVNHVLKNKSYKEIYLVGFSMGGNITLKYLGEENKSTDPRIKKAVAISTPISLSDCAKALSSGISVLYSRNFITRLNKKLIEKKKQIPEFNPDMKKLKKMWKFRDFDNAATAPMNGFKDAQDYWTKASSLHFLPEIQTKTLIINALNDPFLKENCYPFELLKNHPYVDLETPKTGGHVGFMDGGLNQTWTEGRIFDFIRTP